MIPGFNRDQLGNADVHETAVAAMSVIDTLQKHNKGVQIAAICAAFKLLSERCNVPLSDAMTITNNIMNHADGRRPEFKAVEAYLKNEL